MTVPKNIFETKWIPMANSVLFLVFCYLTQEGTTEIIIGGLGGTFIISIILSIRGKFYGFGKAYTRWAALPIVIGLVLGFLIGTGLIWWIYAYFYGFAFEPNS